MTRFESPRRHGPLDLRWSKRGVRSTPKQLALARRAIRMHRTALTGASSQGAISPIPEDTT
jgi:hypothetical protein